jgi:glycine oxidase
MSASSSPRNSQLRVAVVGGGVIGLACALELRARGAQATVYERGTELGAGATSRSAGMLGAAFEWGLEEDQLALAALARRAGDIWPEFAERVERLGGGSIEFSKDGAVVVARNASEAGWIDRLAAACQARSLPVRRLSAAELKQVEPSITADAPGGLLLQNDRQVDPQQVLLRLAAALSRNGVGLRMGRSVDRVAVGADFLMPDGEAFDRIVLATGVGAAEVRFVGRKGGMLETGLAAIVPVKGQMLALAPVSGGPKHVIHARDVYIAPKARWTLVGSTTERGATDTAVDRAVVDALRAKAAQLAGALAAAPEISSWAGVRPGTPDDAPMIGETAIPGVYAALGMYRNGVLLAPAAAELMAAAVIDGKVSAAAAPFAPTRFDNPAKAPHSP